MGTLDNGLKREWLRLTAENARLTSLLAGVEIALARDEDIDGAMKLIVKSRAHQQKADVPK